MAQSIKLLTRGKELTEAEVDDRQLCLSTVGSATAQDLTDIQEALGISTSAALITGATDIGAALADGDLALVYDLSATTNRKSALSRFYTYIQSKLVFTDIPITAGTDIGAALADTDEILAYDASATANRKSAVSRIWTYIQAKIDAGITFAGNQVFTGKVSNTKTAVTVAAAATTFAVTNNFVEVTGDAGANTVATITGGVSGQILTLLFVDGLVTITDTAAATADTVNLSAAFTSSAIDTLTLIYNGVKWIEIARSVN